ncbi:MAG TPA: DUF2071 domain-containing protein [Acidobacteriota bacterium]|nr:DUF2071 domain-containing protein [Acidobacteriota bacterium]
MNAEAPQESDRVRMRETDGAGPIMRQNWRNLLFLHWPLPPQAIQSRLPSGLTVDTFDGQAWIGAVPFTMDGIRRPGLPAIPGLRAMVELNVRTYVHRHRQPGVWFFSLDASHRLMVEVARRFYHLPYFHADMQCVPDAAVIRYSSRRIERGVAEAHFEASWKVGEPLPQVLPDSLDFFLTERYCLYTAHKDRLIQARVRHRPWPLRQAELLSLQSNLLESHGLAVSATDPLLHHCDLLEVEILGFRTVARLTENTWRAGRPS